MGMFTAKEWTNDEGFTRNFRFDPGADGLGGAGPGGDDRTEAGRPGFSTDGCPCTSSSVTKATARGQLRWTCDCSLDEVRNLLRGGRLDG